MVARRSQCHVSTSRPQVIWSAALPLQHNPASSYQYRLDVVWPNSGLDRAANRDSYIAWHHTSRVPQVAHHHCLVGRLRHHAHYAAESRPPATASLGRSQGAWGYGSGSAFQRGRCSAAAAAPAWCAGLTCSASRSCGADRLHVPGCRSPRRLRGRGPWCLRALREAATIQAACVAINAAQLSACASQMGCAMTSHSAPTLELDVPFGV